MKKGCLFDLDGTLVDSLTDLALSTNEVLQNHGFHTHEISCYRQFVGNGVKKLMERALPQEHQECLEECLKEFQTVYERRCLEHTLPYQDIKELIDMLKKDNIKMSVVTNKPHHLAIKIVETLFPDTFISILGQQEAYALKPYPESSYIALMSMGLSKDECYFIGDSHVDIQTGENVDMETIGVCWGFRGRQELENEGATYIVETPLEIKEIIDENRSE